ncbi:hypothetical protein IC617_09670 [Neiella sp. HB171785]|uniref:Uncharacterized protein n=1 Tax=Neiella litorisoli TaxID=2771431 RepID=A0A8J6QK55_9GAMM|nr:hypothetical protein [Neiella litorisoli]MBD1389697.1 hypothetical protein [Neiella litorisoli]
MMKTISAILMASLALTTAVCASANDNQLVALNPSSTGLSHHGMSVQRAQAIVDLTRKAFDGLKDRAIVSVRKDPRGFIVIPSQPILLGSGEDTLQAQESYVISDDLTSITQHIGDEHITKQLPVESPLPE